MDVKRLERVGDDGLELWRPVMKSPLPISAADAVAVFAALRVEATPVRARSELDDLVTAARGSVTLVHVHKTRRHHTIADCMAELTDIRAGDRRTLTLAIESTQPGAVTGLVRELGLKRLPNTSVPRGLRMLIRSDPSGA